ncbi:glycosyltransferase [uncultured Bacteroides sp.]|uniref:glycosyltransferase n=1 Tax=uncultured Bacteroides sp. TaxID=162156 RepID=UPI0025D13CF2|nr:glycosyltransferase [uncultured Bacteroides sp.]
MKVLHISTSDRNGGAAIAAFRLNKAMSDNGIRSNLLVINKATEENNIISAFGRIDKMIHYIFCRVSLILKKKLLGMSYTFSLGIGGRDISKKKIVKEADIIYIHWINNDFLSIKGLNYILSLNKPVVFFMHDMWLITGGCHYSFECQNYQNLCRRCPNIQRTAFKNMVSMVFNKKHTLLVENKNMFIVTPSVWLSNCVNKSSLFQTHKTEIIPNLLDTHVFKPMNQLEVRKKMNLPLDKKLLLFGADGGYSNPYKGWKYLLDALAKLKLEDLEIVVFGSKLDSVSIQQIPYQVHSMGCLRDENTLALLYNAVDVFVTPSLADNFPNTILESLSCGTPVVGFNVGGIPDLIKHQKTGYLAKYRDSQDLAQGMEWCLMHSQDETFLAEIRSFVVKNFSAQVVLEKHLRLFNEILNINGV